jgi:hypothetical protein
VVDLFGVLETGPRPGGGFLARRGMRANMSARVQVLIADDQALTVPGSG